MRSVALGTIAGLIGAGLLHIVIILALPRFTDTTVRNRVLKLGETDSFIALTTEPGLTGLANGDPFLRVAVCAFSLDDAPERFVADGSVPFWSLSVFDAGSNEVFSMNDQTAVDGALDLVIATPRQLEALRKTRQPAQSQPILIGMPATDGYAVLRALAPTNSFEEAARTFLAGATCEPFSE